MNPPGPTTPRISPPPPGSLQAVDEWFTFRRFALILGLLTLAAFPDVVLGLRTFAARDFGVFGYPLAFHHREAFWRGEMPLLNPLNDFGLPFLAQWNTMTLYPGSLVYLLLPLSWSLGLFCLLHLVLGGCGMFLLARHWTGSGLAGAVAGVGYAFNGITLCSLMWPNNIAALAWLPFVVWLLERAWCEGGRTVALAAGAAALQMLTGGPEIILQTWMLVGLLWGMAWVRGERPRWMLVRRMAACGLLVLGVTAAQMLPFFDLLAHSHRDAGFGGNEWAMPGMGWANFLLPLFNLYAFPNGVFHQGDQQWVASYYPGIGVFALALLAVWRVRDRRVWLLGTVCLGGAVLALGHHALLLEWLRKAIPGLGLIRYPIKFVVLVSVTAPLLAAFTLQHLIRGTPQEVGGTQRRAWLLGGGLLLVLGALFWFGQTYPQFEVTPAEAAAYRGSAISRAAFLAVALAGAFALRHLTRPRTAWVPALVYLSLLWLDAYTHAPTPNLRVQRDAYDPGMERVASPPQPGQSRALVPLDAAKRLYRTILPDPYEDFLFHRLGLQANLNLIEGIPTVDGFYSLYLREERAIRLKLTAGENTEGLADFASVSHLTAPGKVTQWLERTNYLPFVTAGQQPVFAEAPATLAALTNFNPREVVFLPPEARAEVKAAARVPAVASLKHCSAHRWEIEVDAPAPTLVVLSQAFFHPWRATVNGAPARLWRANYCFQAVRVPPGVSRVVLRYVDWNFRIGMVISLLSLGVLVQVGRRPRPGGAPAAA